MILEGLKLGAPWLVEVKEGDYILRLGLKGVAYKVTADEKTKVSKLYKVTACFAWVTLVPLILFMLYLDIFIGDGLGSRVILAYLFFLTVAFILVFGLEMLFFSKAKRLLMKPVPIDEGLGYWGMQAQSPDNRTILSKNMSIFFVALISIYLVDIIFYPPEFTNFFMPGILSFIVIKSYCIKKYGFKRVE